MGKKQKLGTVTSFKFLGAVVSDDGSKPEVLSRIAQATAALTKLKPKIYDKRDFFDFHIVNIPFFFFLKVIPVPPLTVYFSSYSVC